MAGLSWLVMVGEVVARADQSAGQLAVTCRADQVTHLALGPNLFAWPTGEAADAAGDSTAPEYRYRYSYRYRYRYRYRYIRRYRDRIQVGEFFLTLNDLQIDK